MLQKVTETCMHQKVMEIYMQTFVGRVVAGDSVWAEVMVLLGLVALGIRLSAWLNQRFSRTA